MHRLCDPVPEKDTPSRYDESGNDQKNEPRFGFEDTVVLSCAPVGVFIYQPSTGDGTKEVPEESWDVY